MVCCGYGSLGVTDPNPFGLPFSTNGFTDPLVQDNCSGAQFGYNFFTTWWSGNTGIVSVDNNGTQTGMGAGAAGVGGSGILDSGDGVDEGFTSGHPNACPRQSQSGSGTTNATPSVTIQGGDFAFVGRDPTVVSSNLFFASGQPAGGTFQWSSTDSNITFDNPTAALVHPTVGFPSNMLHDKSVSVTYTLSNQQGSATSAITARIFKFLIQNVAIPKNFNGPDVFGYELDILYDVHTNPNGQLVAPGFSGISTLENITQISSNVPINPHTGSGATDQNSEVPDTLALVSNQPLPTSLQIVDSQDIGVGGFFVRNNTLTYSSTGVTITNNGPAN